MTLDEFEDRIDRYGENLSAWPRAECAAAEALLQQSEEARAILGEAVALRHALAPAPIKAPAGLADRIVARAAATSPSMPVLAKRLPVRPSVPRAHARLLGLPRWFAVRSLALRPEFVLAACFIAGIMVSLLPFDTASETNAGLELPMLFSRTWR